MQLIRYLNNTNQLKSNALKYLVLLVVGLVFSAETNAQQKPKNSFLHLASGVGAYSFYDSGQSPRTYAGLVLNGSAAAMIVRPNRLSDYQFSFLVGSGDNGLTGKWGATQADVLGIQFIHAEMWRIRKKKNPPLQWWMGTAAHFYNRIGTIAALGNNAVSYDIYAGLGFNNRLEYSFKLPSTKKYRWWLFSWERKQYRPMRIGWESTLPVFSAVIRPSYTGIGNSIHLPASELTKDMLQNARFNWLNQAGVLRSNFYLVYGFHNGNSLQLNWHWNGFYYSDNGHFLPARSANSYLSLGLNIKLDKNKTFWP